MKKQILFLIYLSFTTVAAMHGQGTERGIYGQSRILYYRFDRADVDSSYLDNQRTLSALDEIFSDSILSSRIDSIHIYAFASPEGSRVYNEGLAGRRAESMKEHLVANYPYLWGKDITMYPRGEAWEGLWKLVVWDTQIPEREELLMILSQVQDTDKRKALLKFLNGGRAYKYIEKNVLPRLRNAAICTVWMKPAKEEYIVTTQTLPTLPVIGEEQGTVADRFLPAPIHAPRKTFLALKTNLLFDAALIPNVELEVPIGKRFSVAGELMFPWWLIDNNKYCLQVLAGGLEARCWLGNRKNKYALTGHFAGFYAGGGKYDLQWKEEGYQGEFFIAAGVSYGYAHKIARNLRLEYSLGIGLLRTGYRHYHMRQNYKTLLWQNNGNYTWLGPTKAKVSLVWILNRKMKKGGAR